MKPFDPTPSRLERARREGDHPISRDLVSIAALCAALAGAGMTWPLLRAALPVDMRALLMNQPAPRFWILLAAAAACSCACSAAASVAVTALQTNGLHFRPIDVHLKLARVFGLEPLLDSLRCAAAVAIGALGIGLAVRPSPNAILRTVVIAVVAGIASALCDLMATRSAWRRRLRMTHDELRRDLREQEGDPQTRTRRRRLHRSLLRGGLRHVRRASFVIVNPTHIAIALRYAPPDVPVPAILVRAADGSALRVRALATELRIPIVEDRELARCLFAHEALGPIPSELYLAVAQIVAALQRRA